MQAPYRSEMMRVKPEWIDWNGHLNMAYYSVLFDEGATELFHGRIFGDRYRFDSGFTTFSAEFRIRYVREIFEGDPVYVTAQLLDWDPKRFHFYMELRHADGWLSACGEGLGLHIDRAGPKVAPMPPEIQDKMRALSAAHAKLPVSDWIGKTIAIPGGRFG